MDSEHDIIQLSSTGSSKSWNNNQHRSTTISSSGKQHNQSNTTTSITTIGRFQYGNNNPNQNNKSQNKQNHSSSHKRPRSHTPGKHSQHNNNNEPVYPIQHNLNKYSRGNEPNIDKNNNDKKYRRETKQREEKTKNAVISAAAAEILLPSQAGFLEADGPMEKTYKFTQSQIKSAVDIGIAKKSIDLKLPNHGPYRVAWTRNGRHLLFGGQAGHLAIIDWHTTKISAEFHVREPVYDVTFLHNSQLMAVAQSKYAYIYDHTGAELHALRSHVEPHALTFLPYHFLLASVGTAGFLKYQDVSTGSLVAEHRTKLGSCSVLRHNPWNAVACLGHANGSVTMWTPNMSTAVAKIISHRGPVTALAVDNGGRYMVTAGLDSRVKVWDIRKFQPVHDYFSVVPAHTVDISQRGLVGVGFGSHVQIWNHDFGLEYSNGIESSQLLDPMTNIKTNHTTSNRIVKKYDDDDDDDSEKEDNQGYLSVLRKNAQLLNSSKAKAPYLRHELPGQTVVSLRFQPYEDICAIGHSNGFTSIIVPGAGEPNYDSLVANPYEKKKERQETEVHALLDKLPPTSISLDPNIIGKVDISAPAVKAHEQKKLLLEEGLHPSTISDNEKRAKHKNANYKIEELVAVAGQKRRGIRKALKKQSNIITEQRVALLEKLKEQQEEKKQKSKSTFNNNNSSSSSHQKFSNTEDNDDNNHDTHYYNNNSSSSSSITKSALSRFYKK